MDIILESKNRLKSYCVENGYQKPGYETVDTVEEGVRKFYTVQVNVIGLISAKGEGLSRRIAEYKAALNALKELNVFNDDEKPEPKINNNTDKTLTNGISNTDPENGDKPDPQNADNTDPEFNDNKIDLNTDKINDKQNESEINSKINGNDSNYENIEMDVENTDNEIVSENPINNTETEVLNTSNNNENTVNQNNDNQNTVNNNGNKNVNLINGSIDTNDEQSSGEESDKVGNTVKSDSIESDKLNPRNVSFSKDTKVEEIEKSNIVLVPKFRPIVKNAVSTLLEFCMKNRIPLPFFDNNYRDDSFWVKCRLEINNKGDKEEVLGLGCGDSIQKAKIVASEDVVQQLKDKKLL